MRVNGAAPGSVGLVLADGVALLRPAEQVFEAILAGWRDQQLARNLALCTIEARIGQVKAFAAYVNAFPWQWGAAQADEWFGDLRAVRHCARSTVRSYQGSVRSFCAYLTDPAYGWGDACVERFGTHPIQVVHEWNTAVHVSQSEGETAKRAFTRGSCRPSSTTPTRRCSAKCRPGARAGWRRFATR